MSHRGLLLRRLRFEPLEDRRLLHGGLGHDSDEGSLSIPLSSPAAHDAPLAMHIHARFSVLADGQNVVIPAGLGITAAGMGPVHTHDNSGLIHIESSVVRDFTLGDFLAVAGQPLEAVVEGNQPHYRASLIVNGTSVPVTRSLVLHDQDEIALVIASVPDAASSQTADAQTGAAAAAETIGSGADSNDVATLVATPALKLVDANGAPLALRFEMNTMIVAVATWCPNCAEFEQAVAAGLAASHLAGLKLLFVFGDEGGAGPGGVRYAEALDDLPGEVAFLAPDSVQPTSFPSVYNPLNRQFDQNAFDAVAGWTAHRAIQQAAQSTTASRSGEATSGGGSADVGSGSAALAAIDATAFGQVSWIDGDEVTVLTVDGAGAFNIFYSPNIELGYLDPETGDLLTCDYYPGTSLAIVLNCTANGNLASLVGMHYSNGQVISTNAGNNAFHMDRSTRMAKRCASVEHFSTTTDQFSVPPASPGSTPMQPL